MRQDVGPRLREERDRLGLNQVDFGTLGGVSRRSQVAYESGDGAPDADYLVKIADAGVDVLYVLTGRRDGARPDASASGEVLELFHRLSHGDQATVLQMMRSLARTA